MADYNSSYTGVQIDTAVGKALNPDATPTAESTELITSGAVKAAMDGKVPVYGMGENLLRNWYFVGGGTPGKFPINQRGLTTYTAAGYCIDGWTCGNSTYGSREIVSGGIKVTGVASWHPLYQYFDDVTTSMLYPNTVVTLSALTDTGELLTATGLITTSGISAQNENGFIQAAYENTTNHVRFQIRGFYGKSITIAAAKLEVGTQQTFAHLENGSWVLNEIPDYEEELIKCQTSTADSSDTFANKSLATEQQLAYIENGTTASRAYAVGEYFCWNGLLYRVISAISSGATFTVGTNCEQTTVGDALAFTIYTGTAATNTVPGTSYTIINAVSLPSGKYLIIGSASNGTNVSGTLALTITNATAGVNVVTNRTSTESGGGNTVCAIVELGVTSTIRLRATQTTGSSLSLNTNSMTAIKLA